MNQTLLPANARVLLVRLSALGDVVLTLPLVNALLAKGVRLTWLIERKFLPVVAHLADRVNLLPIDSPRRVADYRAILTALSAHHFDVLLAAQAKLRINVLYPFIKADLKLGFDTRRAKDLHGLFVNARIPRADHHLADGLLAFAGYFGIAEGDPDYAPPVDAEAARWCREQIGGGDYVLLNPTSSKAERDWPLKRQTEFVTRLRETGWSGRLVVAGGPAARDVEWAGEIAKASGNACNLAGQTTLPRLFALIAGAKVLVSPDSGPVHIATAYGVPVVGLYAVARAALSGPWRHTEFCVDVYDQAMKQLSGKDPARADWHARVHDGHAMALISVDQALEATRRALAASVR